MMLRIFLSGAALARNVKCQMTKVSQRLPIQ